MEKKQTNGKKIGRILLLIFAGLLLLLLSMGATILIQQSVQSNKAPSPTTAPTDTPAPTALPDRSYDSWNKPAFEPDTGRLGLTEEELSSYDEDYFGAENWLDITPEELQKIGCAVIRHIGTGYSYVVIEGEYYRLGEGNDGKGVLDVILCDLNFDEMPDLLYTYHFGTGSEAQTKVGWFDPDSKTQKLSPFGMLNDYLALNPEDGAYVLYRCTRFVDENGGFALHFTDRIGEVIEQGGELFLILD